MRVEAIIFHRITQQSYWSWYYRS